MSVDKVMALVWWTTDNRTSIVKISDVNEKDRRIGCVSRIRYGKRRFLAEILQISSDKEFLQRVQDYFLMEVNRQFATKGYCTQGAALLSKMSSTLSTSECAEVAAAANGSTLLLESEKNEEPLANTTNARMNLRSRDYVDSNSLCCYENFEYEHTTDDEESKYYCLATTSKETVETTRNVMSIESDANAAATADNVIRSKREVTSDNTDRRDTHRNDRRRTREKRRRNTDVENNRRKDARERREANRNFDGLEFMKPYRGNPDCINMIRDLLVYLQSTSAEGKNILRDGALIPTDNSMFIDLLPIPLEVAKVSLQENSGVYIPKIAERRIISKVRTIQQTKNRSGWINDESIGPATMIRLILHELYGRDQMAEASAFGTNGKKAIPKRILRAIYYFTRRNFPANDLSWTRFVNIVNRKCGQLANKRKERAKLRERLSKGATTKDGDTNIRQLERDSSRRRETYIKSEVESDTHLEPFAQEATDSSIAESYILTILNSDVTELNMQTSNNAAKPNVEECGPGKQNDAISSTVPIESSVNCDVQPLPSYQQLRGELLTSYSMSRSSFDTNSYAYFNSDNVNSNNEFAANICPGATSCSMSRSSLDTNSYAYFNSDNVNSSTEFASNIRPGTNFYVASDWR